MKPFTNFTIILAAVCGISFAKTITVDNKPGAVAMYADFASAVAAADPGDTLLLAGSPTSYGTHTLYKRLTIIGPGYFLAENKIPGADSHPASINLYLRRKIGIDSSGYVLSGLKCGVIDARSWNDPDASGVASTAPSAFVSKCQISGLSLGSASRIEQVYVFGTAVIAGDDSVIKNSYFNAIIFEINSETYSQNSTVENCVFYYAPGNNRAGQESNSFVNCIFLTGGPARGSVSYSLFCNAAASSGVGNQGGMSSSNVLIRGGSLSWDLDLQLKPNSPAIGAGFGGTDIGVFGGDKPYVLSGLPNRPRITQLIVPSTVTEGSGLPFQVTAEGH